MLCSVTKPLKAWRRDARGAADAARAHSPGGTVITRLVSKTKPFSFLIFHESLIKLQFLYTLRERLVRVRVRGVLLLNGRQHVSEFSDLASFIGHGGNPERAIRRHYHKKIWGLQIQARLQWVDCVYVMCVLCREHSWRGHIATCQYVRISSWIIWWQNSRQIKRYIFWTNNHGLNTCVCSVLGCNTRIMLYKRRTMSLKMDLHPARLTDELSLYIISIIYLHILEVRVFHRRIGYSNIVNGFGI